MTVYLDHAATTPMYPEAVAAMSEALAGLGNASSQHASGRRARRLVEEAREDIATSFGAEPAELLFTGGGTESDNLAVKGIYWARKTANARRRRILVSTVEHPAVLDTVRWLAERENAELTWLEVDHTGQVQPEILAAAIESDPDSVALVTVMLANNEVGTVNPIATLAQIAHQHGIPMHSDAVQAAGALPVNFANLGVDALTLTGHKFGGPYGIGLLLLNRKTSCVPLHHGGGQERDVRSGTLDVPAVLGLAAAARKTAQEQPETAAELVNLRDTLIAGVRAAVPDAVLNGANPASTVDGLAGRLPGNAHFTFPGCAGDSLLMLLDAQGVECSTGSACAAGVAQPSHVLLAMGASAEAAKGSLRFSLGHTSTNADVSALTSVIGSAVAMAKAAGLPSKRSVRPQAGV